MVEATTIATTRISNPIISNIQMFHQPIQSLTDLNPELLRDLKKQNERLHLYELNYNLASMLSINHIYLPDLLIDPKLPGLDN
jgi:hypothetical protein